MNYIEIATSLTRLESCALIPDPFVRAAAYKTLLAEFTPTQLAVMLAVVTEGVFRGADAARAAARHFTNHTDGSQ